MGAVREGSSKGQEGGSADAGGSHPTKGTCEAPDLDSRCHDGAGSSQPRENPSGLLCFRDEIAGLLGAFDRYGGSGSDRAFWLETYGGRPYRYDRVALKGETIDIPFCSVSLLGGLQPDRLNSMLLSGDDDGLAARPLYAWPDPVPPRRPPDPRPARPPSRVAEALGSRGFDTGDDGKARPRTILLEEDAADEFQAWWEHKQWDAKLGAGGRLAGAIGKLDGVTLRIAQVLEFLTWAWAQSNTPEPEKVSLETVRNTLKIIDEWVRPNLHRVFAEASLPEAQRSAMIVGRWLLKTRTKTVNARDLRRQPGICWTEEIQGARCCVGGPCRCSLVDPCFKRQTRPPTQGLRRQFGHL